ncbi:hypothetical protein [uncultured Paracoccus sp.]|uniref:hypothetical protein n=1 Tax=uncultured Paracoccus sp. TaxID=189685 RepID=UPI0025FBA365|nr:hypothetical protein [uncultured Paracoccus sp.]
MADPEGARQRSMTAPGLTPRLLRSWRAPGQVVRGLREIPESALLAVLMGAMLVFWVSQLPLHARAARLDPAIPLNARIAGALMAVMFIMPLLCYLAAGLVGLLARLTPWRLEQKDSRLALFWALLAVCPAMLLSGMVAGVIGPGPALQATRLVSGLGFLFIWGAGLRVLAERK